MPGASVGALGLRAAWTQRPASEARIPYAGVVLDIATGRSRRGSRAPIIRRNQPDDSSVHAPRHATGAVQFRAISRAASLARTDHRSLSQPVAGEPGARRMGPSALVRAAAGHRRRVSSGQITVHTWESRVRAAACSEGRADGDVGRALHDASAAGERYPADRPGLESSRVADAVARTEATRSGRHSLPSTASGRPDAGLAQPLRPSRSAHGATAQAAGTGHALDRTVRGRQVAA